ncbi:hypothetical protein PVAP13_2NG449300, partial [Panicum virgatum]
TTTGGAPYGKREGAVRGCLSALRAKGMAASGAGGEVVSCVPGDEDRRGSCGRMTEWLMESLRKDATGRGGRQGPPGPWETGAAKPRGTPNCSFRSCMVGRARRQGRTPALVTLRNREESSKGLVGKRHFY